MKRISLTAHTPADMITSTTKFVLFNTAEGATIARLGRNAGLRPDVLTDAGLDIVIAAPGFTLVITGVADEPAQQAIMNRLNAQLA